MRRAAVCVAALLLAGLADAREIPLTRDGSMYRVPVTLEGRLVRPFILDTGAGEVQVSSELMRALFPRGSAQPTYLTDGTYRLADGRVVRNRRIMIGSLRIGDRELRDVAASVGGPDASLLLGQNALDRLGTWTIDGRRAVLALGEPPRRRPSAECADWRTAPDDCEVAAVRDFLRDIRPPHDPTRLTLLRSDGERAAVLVDVVRAGLRRTARLCGPMDLRRAETGWRVVAASGLYEVGPDVPCRP
jgi:gag-polyprotein putative aspartyl protease